MKLKTSCEAFVGNSIFMDGVELELEFYLMIFFMRIGLVDELYCEMVFSA